MSVSLDVPWLVSRAGAYWIAVDYMAHDISWEREGGFVRSQNTVQYIFTAYLNFITLLVASSLFVISSVLSQNWTVYFWSYFKCVHHLRVYRSLMAHRAPVGTMVLKTFIRRSLWHKLYQLHVKLNMLIGIWQKFGEGRGRPVLLQWFVWHPHPPLRARASWRPRPVKLPRPAELGCGPSSAHAHFCSLRALWEGSDVSLMQNWEPCSKTNKDRHGRAQWLLHAQFTWTCSAFFWGGVYGHGFATDTTKRKIWVVMCIWKHWYYIKQFWKLDKKEWD